MLAAEATLAQWLAERESPDEGDYAYVCVPIFSR